MNTNISWDFQICISVPLRFYKTKPYKWLQKAFRWCFCGLYNNTLLGFLRNISDFLEKVLWQVGPHVGYFLPVFMKFYPLTTTNFSQMSWNFYQTSILSRQTNKSDLKNRSRGGSRAAAAILDLLWEVVIVLLMKLSVFKHLFFWLFHAIFKSDLTPTQHEILDSVLIQENTGK